MLDADAGLADYGKLLVYSAMAVYVLAFLAYIAEWAFGSRSRVARTAAALTPTTAGKGDAEGGGRAAAGAVPAVTVRKGGATSVLERPDTGRRTGGDGPTVVTRSGAVGRDDVPDGPGAAAGDERGDLYGRIAVSLTVLAFVLHLGGVVLRAVAVQRAPWANMYEFSTTFSMVAVGAFLAFMLAGRNVGWLGLPLVTTVLLDLGLAVTVLYTESDQLPPALQSVWMWIHVSLAIVCGAMFYLGAVATVAFLFRDRYESKLLAGGTPGRVTTSVLERLPSSVSLDRFAYRINAVVFPLWTFTIIAGAIWAENAWGRYWGWDPKEVWSFITWLGYAAYLHARSTAGWRGRKAAYLAIFAFLCFLFNYYGVNMFVDSLHSYAGVD
ncbi:c-type cytochrome biogenesis protein CcsB [Streptomyces alkaliphilus]|uniref:C-type cytochrome biogenesis protein CcsB n=1 Tax=Streptomyces alkaliphilus TaxID=1472722 RepID=A0A7W3Y266_9ACTN|nr:c-type cytochrome biogenesis protein CcsB [Streptomyces alkaliphilus]MBB0245233.1 c-type cytochrome biogenesis protein CcsB [Streptomyces alkaliphilus]